MFFTFIKITLVFELNIYIYIYTCNLLIGLNSKVNFLREMDIYFKLFHFREKCNNINKKNN